MGGGEEARARPSLTSSLARWRSWSQEEPGTGERLLLPLHRPGGKASWAPPMADAGQAGGGQPRAWPPGPSDKGMAGSQWPQQPRTLAWRPVWAGPLPGQGRGPRGGWAPLCLPLSSQGIQNPSPLLKPVAPSRVDGGVGLTCAPSPCTPRESPPPPGGWPRGSSSLTPTPPGSHPPPPGGWPRGVLITCSHTPRTVCSLSSFSHEPWKWWTFPESRHVGSGLGVAWSSRVPGKFWMLMWALMACLQR